MAIISSRDWNPFLAAGRALGRLGNTSVESAQQQALRGHLMAAQQTHEHAVNLLNAHYSAANSYMNEVNKLAEPGTAVQTEAGPFKSAYTKRTPKKRVPKAPQKTPRPLPVRDPMTGRAMRAPE